MPRTNRLKEAFKENYNTIGLATTAAVSMALLNPVPLLVGLVMEAAYLLVVPDSKWYESRLSRRYDAEVEARRRKLKEQTLPTLRPQVQEQFLRLEEMRRQIDAQSQDDKVWYREVIRKLDYLLEKFLLFAGKEGEFRRYLESLRQETRGERPPNRTPKDEIPRRQLRPSQSRPNPEPERPVVSNGDAQWIQRAVEEVQAAYEQERASLERTMKEETDEDTRSVLIKRADVLHRRSEFVDKIGKILTNLNHQLHLVEDTFGLINDEIRARSPEQILADVEEVVVATDTMASALEEFAPLEQMVARVGN